MEGLELCLGALQAVDIPEVEPEADVVRVIYSLSLARGGREPARDQRAVCRVYWPEARLHYVGRPAATAPGQRSVHEQQPQHTTRNTSSTQHATPLIQLLLAC